MKMTKFGISELIQPVFKAEVFKCKALLLFWSAVLLMHALVPVQADISIIAIICFIFGVYAANKAGFFSVEPWKDISKAGLAGMLSFDAYVFFLVASAVLNPSTAGAATRIISWVCCVGAGFLLSRIIPKHNFDFYYPLFIVLALSFLSIPVLYFLGFSESLWHDSRLKLFAIHPSHLALCAAPVLFWASARLLNLLQNPLENRRARPILSALALILSLSIILLSNTRSMIFALPPSFIFLVFFSGSRSKRWLFILLAIFCFFLVSIAYFPKDDFKTNRPLPVITNPVADPTFQSRTLIWEAGWDSLKKSSLLGHGVKSFRGLYTQYLSEHKEELEQRFEWYESDVEQANNLILGRLVETGILGTCAFLFFYLSAIYVAIRYGGQNRWIAAFLFFYLLAGMVDDGLFRINDIIVLFAAGAALGSRPSTMEFGSKKDYL